MNTTAQSDQVNKRDQATQNRETRTQRGIERLEQQLQENDPHHVYLAEVAHISGLDEAKLMYGLYKSPKDVHNKIKGALGELAMVHMLEAKYGCFADYEPIFLKPEEELEIHHREALWGNRPDAVIFGEPSREPVDIWHVCDAKAWAAHSLPLGEQSLYRRAEKYARLSELHPLGDIIFAFPDDTIQAQRALVQKIEQWRIGDHTIKVIPLGCTNAELDRKANSVIEGLRGWEKIKQSRTAETSSTHANAS